VDANFIYDPCFGGGNQVVCPYNSPDSVAVMQLTRPLPVFSASSSLPYPYPWLLTLADGEQCWRQSGATIAYDGMPLNYFCSKGDDNLYGEVNNADPVWTIFEARKGSSDMTQAAIAKAYY
jgi:hypothetical protein